MEVQICLTVNVNCIFLSDFQSVHFGTSMSNSEFNFYVLLSKRF